MTKQKRPKVELFYICNNLMAGEEGLKSNLWLVYSFPFLATFFRLVILAEFKS